MRLSGNPGPGVFGWHGHGFVAMSSASALPADMATKPWPCHPVKEAA